jgi:hypothetical protein
LNEAVPPDTPSTISAPVDSTFQPGGAVFKYIQIIVLDVPSMIIEDAATPLVGKEAVYAPVVT